MRQASRLRAGGTTFVTTAAPVTASATTFGPMMAFRMLTSAGPTAGMDAIPVTVKTFDVRRASADVRWLMRGFLLWAQMTSRTTSAPRAAYATC